MANLILKLSYWIKGHIIGWSIFRNISEAASALGLDAYRIVKSGWNLSKDNVDKLIPDLKELLDSVPPGGAVLSGQHKLPGPERGREHERNQQVCVEIDVLHQTKHWNIPSSRSSVFLRSAVHIQRWNYLTEVLVEVSRHKLESSQTRVFVRFSTLVFCSKKCYSWIDSSFLVSRIFLYGVLNQEYGFKARVWFSVKSASRRDCE